MEKIDKIVFVYNANSGLFSSLKDTVHKTVSPETYECNLCQITFGAFNMKDEWKEFIETLSYKTEFLHKDEFDKKYGKTKYAFPNAFIIKEGNLKLLITKEEINSAKSIKDLKGLVNKKIKMYENGIRK